MLSAMPRRFFRKYLPDPERMRQHRFLARFGTRLHHPNLWHLNRRSVSGGVAAGMFAGLVPGSNPVQFAVGALLAVLFRVNLPVAVAVTLYTNPFTIVPLYVIAYAIGASVVGTDGTAMSQPPGMDWSHLGVSMQVYFDWVLSLGKPLAVGLVVLASGLAVAGYVFVQLAWRVYVLHAWRRRRARSPSAPDSASRPAAAARGARAPRAPGSWVTMTKLVPRAAVEFQHQLEHACAAVCRSRLPVGSSASTHAGRVTSARASAARWRSPPESSPGVWSRRSPRPTSSRIAARASLRLVRGMRRMSSGMATFSSAVNSISR